MPQLDFITNLSFLQGFLLLVLLGFVYLSEYLNESVHTFSENVFNFFSQAPTFLGLLTSKSIIFFWIAAQYTKRQFISLRRIVSFRREK